MRKEIFLLYIKNIIDYISIKYKTKYLYSKQDIINRFATIIDVLVEKSDARLDAIFAYEKFMISNKLSISDKSPFVFY